MKSSLHLLCLILCIVCYSNSIQAQNNSLDFADTQDVVYIPNTANLSPATNELTIEMWVYLDVLPSQFSGFRSLYDSPQDAYILYLDGNQNELRFKITDQDGTAERPGIPSADLSTNTWLHIAGVYDGNSGKAKIYLNGELKDTHPNLSLMDNVLSGQNPILGNNFNGKMDEIRIWDRALCEEELLFHMNCELTGSEPGLFSYYDFNHGIANDNNIGVTTLEDLAGGSDGELTNFLLAGSSSNWVTGASTVNGNCTTFSLPVFSVEGNNMVIQDGDTSPSLDDFTDFGTSSAKTFFIHNDGNASMKINSIALSGDDASDFSVGSVNSVNGNDQHSFSVSFTPNSALGMKTATVEIVYSICGEVFIHDFSIQKFYNTRTWDKGANTNNWADAANWLPDGVPNNWEEVIIETGDIVTIDANTYNIAYLEMDNNSGIINNGTLNITNTFKDGIQIYNGSFVNNGTLDFTNLSSRGIRLRNSSTFSNNGMLTITNTTDVGIVLDDSSTFSNTSTITMSQVYRGIDTYTSSTFTNDGLIDVSDSNSGFLVINSSTFTNNANISLTNITTTNFFIISIFDSAILNNNVDGSITITNVIRGIYIYNILNNWGTIVFDQFQNTALQVEEILNNYPNATIELKNGTDALAISSDSNQTITNQGNIKIDNCNNGMFVNREFINEGHIEVINSASSSARFNKAFSNTSGATIICKNLGTTAVIFDNSSGQGTNNGLIRVENCRQGIWVQTDFTNNGEIEVQTAYDGHGILFDHPIIFNNNGTISIDDISREGLRLYSTVEFQNNQSGEIYISTTNRGLYLSGAGQKIDNHGLLDISNTSDSGINSYGEFTNHPTGIINIQTTGQQGIESFAQPFVNQGALTIMGTTEEAIDADNFSSTGDLKGVGDYELQNSLGGNIMPGASPGTMTFLADQTFTGSIQMEIEGTTPDTEHDQIIVNGNATLTGTTIEVSLLNGYVPPIGQTTNFTILTATSIIGTPIINLPPNTAQNGWSSSINANSIVITSSAFLPVELTNFNLRVEENEQVILHWSTASETNNDGFFVQYSTDGKSWENLAFQAGAGTTSEQQSYQYTHHYPTTGTNYYRLKQIDFDGAFEYSKILSAKLDVSNLEAIQVFPNPFIGKIIVDGFSGKLQLYNERGVPVVSLKKYEEGAEIDLSFLPKGIYFLQLSNKNEKKSLKIFKQ